MIDTIISDALATIDENHATILQNLTGEVTVEERDTWPVKGQAAMAIKAGTATAAQTAMIRTEADLAGDDFNQLVDYLIARTESSMQIVGLASGLRRAARAAIRACTTEAEVKAALASIDSQTEAALAQVLASQATT